MRADRARFHPVERERRLPMAGGRKDAPCRTSGSLRRGLALAAVLGLLAPAGLVPGVAAQGTRAPELVLLRVEEERTLVDDRIAADLDGDEATDLLLLGRAPGPTWLAYRQREDGSGFELVHRLPVPEGTAAFSLARLAPPAGLDILLLRAGGADLLAGPLGEDPAPVACVEAELVFAPEISGVPRFWTWGRDVDGDGHEDLLLPGIEESLLLRGGPEGKPRMPLLPVRPPAETSAGPGARGLLVLQRRSPRVDFVALRRDAPLLPAFHRDGTGLMERPPLEGGGFGGAPQVHFGIPSDASQHRATSLLERNEVVITDLNGDGLDDLIAAHTGAVAGALSELRTELRFYVNQGVPASKPSHALLLSGVLSAGPELRDVDGDGHADLFLSVFAGGARSELARRVLGRVKIEYHLYLGTGKDPPFERSPALSLEDVMSLEDFESWRLHQRLFLAADWNGDGRKDLVRLSKPRTGLVATLHLASAPGSPFAISESPAATLELPQAVLGYGMTSLSPSRPALLLHLEHGAACIAPARR